MIRTASGFVLVLALAFASSPGLTQPAPDLPKMPSFDAATIKPPDPNALGLHAGFSGEPGGRVHFGGNIKMLVQTAFNLQDDQVVGGPDWSGSQWFEINAVPSEASPSRNIRVENANPSPEQCLLLQSLLRDRFGFKSHFETRVGEVYILTRGKRALQLETPKDPAADPRAIVLMKQGGIADGEGVGTNTTMDYLAWRLGRYLQLPVENQTGIGGSYDFHLPAVDPDSKDLIGDVFGVVDRLGLKLTRGRGPRETLVIDHVDQPSEN